MPKAEMRETPEIIPRYHALCIEGNGTRFYFSPAAEIMGHALRRSPRNLRKILMATSRYKQRQWDEYKEGRSYEPKFPWPEELLKEGPDKIPEIVRDGVKKKNGTYILFDVEPGEAIQNLTLKGGVLDAQVKSKGTPNENRPNYHRCQLRDAFVTNLGSPHLIVVACNCDDHFFDLERGGMETQNFVQCVHGSAMRSEFEERVYNNPPNRIPMKIKGRMPRREVFSPFPFTPNWYYRNGRLQAKDRHLAALEGDVLVTYYVIRGEDDNFFGVNRRLLTIEECYTPMILEGIRTGRVTRRLIGQRRKKAPIGRDRLRWLKELGSGFTTDIRACGYEYDGLTLELDRVARRYVNEDNGNVVNIVFSAKEPPFYTVREPIPGSTPVPTGEYEGEADPFKLVGKRGLRAFDDVTMRDTKLRVEVPSVLRLPEEGYKPIDMGLKKEQRQIFRNAIRKAHGEQVTSIEKYARVHFC